MSPSPVSVDKITRFVVYRWYLASRVICIYEIIHSLCNINVLLIHSRLSNSCMKQVPVLLYADRTTVGFLLEASFSLVPSFFTLTSMELEKDAWGACFAGYF